MTDTSTDPTSNGTAPAMTAEDLRASILGFDDTQEQGVNVPEWGGVNLLVRGMTGEERADMFRRATDPETGEMAFDALYPEIIISTCFFPAQPDTRVFQAGDRVALNKKSGAALERVARVALKLSGMDRESREALGEGSGSTPSEGSTSG